MQSIPDNLQRVRERIHQAEQAAGRAPGSVGLIAVSKTKPANLLREAYDADQRLFGESYLQEALEKIAALEQDIDWHFIGPIQSNKTRQITEHFHWVHSVDRLKIAKRLAEQRPDESPPLNVCLQVNINAEESKSGVLIEQLPELAAEVAQLDRLVLRGLMAIPQKAVEFELQRANFAKLARALERLNQQLGLSLDTLSMGMSSDLEAAVAEGATFVRIGTDIFGARN